MSDPHQSDLRARFAAFQQAPAVERLSLAQLLAVLHAEMTAVGTDRSQSAYVAAITLYWASRIEAILRTEPSR